MSDDAGHHVGRRHTDPKHKAGDWWTQRDDNTTTDQQGGRTHRGARHSTDEEKP